MNNYLIAHKPAQRLYMKGGTTVNKLYLKETSLLSVDLDFKPHRRKRRSLERKANGSRAYLQDF
jgi:predicted nucleotidyltransferase component of viral defense system